MLSAGNCQQVSREKLGKPVRGAGRGTFPGSSPGNRAGKGVPEFVLPSPRGRWMRHKNHPTALPTWPPSVYTYTQAQNSPPGNSPDKQSVLCSLTARQRQEHSYPGSPAKQPPSTPTISFSCKRGPQGGYTQTQPQAAWLLGGPGSECPAQQSPGLSKGPASERQLGTFQDYVPCCSEAPGAATGPRNRTFLGPTWTVFQGLPELSELRGPRRPGQPPAPPGPGILGLETAGRAAGLGWSGGRKCPGGR